MSEIIWIIIALVTLVAGYAIATAVSKNMAKSRANTIIDGARREAEMLKEKKLLEAKEQEMQLLNDAEKAANQKMQKIQTTEARLKQRELQLNQQQSDLAKRKNELDALKVNVDNQQQELDLKSAEVEKLQKDAQETLERISGLSAEEAKEKLIESLKDEAKSAAAGYINDIMDDAKMTANKEAKRIVIQSIQRVATETAVENSVTVFHIENDEIKGRIIGREGRNIRALEAATGIEIIVDDTPEAIVLSGFDPVRREIARLALHQLVADGRIHPARIEEVVAKVRRQVE